MLSPYCAVRHLASCLLPGNAKNIHLEIRRLHRGHSLMSTVSTVIEQPDVNSALAVGDLVFIMFAKTTWLQHKLEIGVRLRVHAPWYVL